LTATLTISLSQLVGIRFLEAGRVGRSFLNLGIELRLRFYCHETRQRGTQEQPAENVQANLLTWTGSSAVRRYILFQSTRIEEVPETG
jgi:hypothetical protein